MQAYIDYQQLLEGEYKKGSRYNSLAAYEMSKGYNVKTNIFADKNLNVENNESLFIVLFKIITSARLQLDFSDIKVSIPSSLIEDLTEIKFLEEISLSEIEIEKGDNFSQIFIKLIEKNAYKKFIEPYVNMTNLHPKYKTKNEIAELKAEKVPKIPSLEDVIIIIDKYKIRCHAEIIFLMRNIGILACTMTG